jgi:YHYH protein
MNRTRQNTKVTLKSALTLFIGVGLTGCNSSVPNEASRIAPTGNAKVELASFSKDAMVKEPTTVDCVLTDGAKSKCAQITVKYKPDSLRIGPFCPATINEAGGIWNWDGEKSGLYRINGPFLKMLNEMGYEFYSADGKVHITTNIASRPAFDHTCMSMKPQTAVTMTILLPMTPKMASEPTELGTVAKVGLALDGVPIFADAPSVLDTGHMPALDECGGHIDPGGWYHWHATATDINALYQKKKVSARCALQQEPSAQFGYAFDGFAMLGTADTDGIVPRNLDACHGHFGPTKANREGEYHYHATADFPNLPACLKGVEAKNNFSTTSTTGIGSPRWWQKWLGKASQ